MVLGGTFDRLHVGHKATSTLHDNREVLQEDACILLIMDGPARQSSLSSFFFNDRVPEQVLLTVAAVMAEGGARSVCKHSSMSM